MDLAFIKEMAYKKKLHHCIKMPIMRKFELKNKKVKLDNHDIYLTKKNRKRCRLVASDGMVCLKMENKKFPY